MTIVGDRRLDPEVVAVVQALPFEIPTAVSDHRIGEIRALMDSLFADVDVAEGIDRTDVGLGDDPGVELRIHRPSTIDTLPCIYWIHGGGLFAGSHTSDDERLQRWCRLFDCVTVSVRYRLAPEHPYPAGLDDCYHGLLWVHRHAHELGIAPSKIGVVGGSAGGCLAAALALRVRDDPEARVAFQALYAPMLDDRQITSSSRWDIRFVWDPTTNATAWAAYLGQPAAGEVPAFAAPARASGLSGLPPTFISSGGADIFLDEDLDYARRLIDAGVSTELHVYPDAPHGFESLAPDAMVGRRFWHDLESWLSVQLNI